MSRKDQITGKGAMSGNKRSKAMNATRRKWNLNLQKATVKTETGTATIKVSARTKKTLAKKGRLA